jgi:hypothetical protein
MKQKKCYLPIKKCLSFWYWLYHTWDFPIGWEGPYYQKREHGRRLFGFERSYEYLVGGDDYQGV